MNTPYQHILSTHPINPSYYNTPPSRLPTNKPPHILRTHLLNFLSSLLNTLVVKALHKQLSVHSRDLEAFGQAERWLLALHLSNNNSSGKNINNSSSKNNSSSSSNSNNAGGRLLSQLPQQATCVGYLQHTLAFRANASQQGSGHTSPLSLAHTLVTHPGRSGGGGNGRSDHNNNNNNSNNNNNIHSTVFRDAAQGPGLGSGPGQGLVVETLLLPLTLCVTVSDLALVSRVIQVTPPPVLGSPITSI